MPVLNPDKPAQALLDPDADLITGLKARDERALAALMDRHMRSLYKLAYYMLGDAMSAEDITQRVFIKTWEHSVNWQPGQAKLLSWMRRVATNACLDQIKKKKPIYTDVVPDSADPADTAYDIIVKTEQKKSVKFAISELPDKQKTALVLSYYQEVSQKEGAAIMDITVSAYESLLVRARKTLKINLADIPHGLEA